jgi:large subunit ribosomal protein L5
MENNIPRLKIKYQKEITPALKKELDLKNVQSVPRVQKVVINSGIGDMIKNKEAQEDFKKELSIITGQNPAVRDAKVSVASFAVRRGMPVGLTVTLRGNRMYSFLDRLFSIVLPRLRDFRGVSGKSFDKHGNYTLGVKEHNVFPEIDMSKTQPRGLEVTIVTSTKDTEKARRLLSLLGMPFEKN